MNWLFPCRLTRTDTKSSFIAKLPQLLPSGGLCVGGSPKYGTKLVNPACEALSVPDILAIL